MNVDALDAGFVARLQSMTSRLKPRRSVQRRYMRISISAQSCDSVPPAPGWIVTIAFLRSSSPESIVRISPVWTSLVEPSSAAREIVARRLRPASPTRRARARSSVLFLERLGSVASSSSRRRRCSTFCAAAWSFQKSGAATWFEVGQLIGERASSKPPPQIGGAPGEVAVPADQFVEVHQKS